jgi:ATP-dependent helicase HrpA
VDEKACEWLVPGLLRDKVTHLVKSLPKNLRKNFVPVPQHVTAALEVLDTEGDRALLLALSEALKRTTGVDVPLDAWDQSDLPPYLRMNFKVVDDESARELAMGRDLPALRKELGVKARRQFSEGAKDRFERKGLTDWEFGELPEQVEFVRGGQTLVGYPALIDEGDSVSLMVLDTEHDADVATRRGLRRLFQLAVPEQVKFLARNLPGFQEMSLKYSFLLELEGGRAQEKGAIADRLRGELVEAACDRAFFVEEERVRDKAAFQARVAKAKTRLTDVASEICRVMREILDEYQELRPRLNQPGVATWQRVMTDIRNQLKALMPPGFLGSVPLTRLKHYPRYLHAARMRLDKFTLNPAKDAQWMQQIQSWWQAYEGRLKGDRASGVFEPKLDEFRWMLEELRVSLWAQQLKTPYPVSFKRMEKYWAELG